MYRILLISALLLAACDNVSIPQKKVEGSPREVVLVAIAPDGTHLWGVYEKGVSVFFASCGAHWKTSNGKVTTRHDVPTGRQ